MGNDRRPAPDPRHARRQRLLELLRAAGDRPVTLADLEGAGFAAPATEIYELELAGYTIEHVHRRGRVVGFRLFGESLVLAPETRRRRFTLPRRPAR
jgi:biotin operon repressor